MTWISIFVIALMWVAVVPVLYLAHVQRKNVRRRRRLRPFHLLRAEAAGAGREHAATFDEPFSRRLQPVRIVRQWSNHTSREDSGVMAGDPPPGDLTARGRRAFEYMIRRHVGAIRQHTADLGGFAEVALMLHDNGGNSFTIHRRISMN